MKLACLQSNGLFIRLAWLLFTLSAQFSSAFAQTSAARVGASPEDVRRASYALGLQQAASLRREFGPTAALDPEQVAAGVRDSLAGAKPAYPSAELSRSLRAVFGGLSIDSREFASRSKDARDFLARNRVASGIVELPNGVQYRVVREGSGPIPRGQDLVRAEFTAKLVDGTPVDSSKERGGAKLVELRSIARGWGLVLPRVKQGSRVEVFAPPAVAFGISGVPGKVPPYSVIIYDIELVEVQPSAAAASPSPPGNPSR